MGLFSNIKIFLNPLARSVGLLAVLTHCTAVNALEANIELHHATSSGTFGYAISAAEQFSTRSQYGWAVSYHKISGLSAKWNNEELFFDSATIDTVLTYRYRARSYNRLMKRLTFEVQGGVSWQLTNNQFIWKELEQEITLSEKGDVNPVLAVLSHYKYSPKLSYQLGVKYYPKFSNFDDVTTIFAGVTYRFGKQYGY